jgi:acyl-CoA reductase-like NAD-dependent aldehyde dehydrogenase
LVAAGERRAAADRPSRGGAIDNGKPIRESRDLDIPLVARHFAYHAGWAQLMADELPGYEPVGVVGQIIPWNFPLLMLAWKVAPALAKGNTVVLKPAEFTPLTALLFAEIAAASDLPPGVVNVVTGDGSTGAAESLRSSSSTMPTSMGRSRAWSMRSGSTRARCAVRARGCSCRSL